MKIETLEEAAISYAVDVNTKMGSNKDIYQNFSRLDFIAGAEWQAERMYSEEDMIEFAKWVFLEVGSNTGKDRTNKELFNEWFEQFKNK